MAVRLNPKNAESVRMKIQVSQLINRVQNHALAKVEMTPTQLDAAKFLLNKRIPNPPTEVGGIDGQAIALEAVLKIVSSTEAA